MKMPKSEDYGNYYLIDIINDFSWMLPGRQ